MFWNSSTFPAFYFTPLIPLYLSQSPQPSQSFPIPSSGTEIKKEPEKPKTPLLRLTRKDLERAGYDRKKRPWTEEEDEKLRSLKEQGKLQWNEISNSIQGRNSKMCYNRYRRLQQNVKNLWKKSQNDQLSALVEQFGENWKKIQKQFPGRSRKQLKEHYLNYLKPQIKKDDWTIEEDLKLIKFLNIYGKNWTYLEENFEGRTQSQLKNRYFGRLKKIAERKAQINCKEESNMNDQINELQQS